MAVHSKNEALMCKVFPSSLGPVAMRWFDGLRVGSIDSFKELTQAFGSRFITCSRVPRPLASLLSLSIREGETLKTHSDRYWEMFNEIDGDFDDVAINTFKFGFERSNFVVVIGLILACGHHGIGGWVVVKVVVFFFFFFFF